MQKIEGIENMEEMRKKFCQPKFSATKPEVGDNSPLLKADMEIKIA